MAQFWQPRTIQNPLKIERERERENQITWLEPVNDSMRGRSNSFHLQESVFLEKRSLSASGHESSTGLNCSDVFFFVYTSAVSVSYLCFIMIMIVR